MISTDLVFRVGNAKIIIMENYEALGRYITAKEQAEKFKRDRDMHLHNLGTCAARATKSSSSGYIATDFDVQAAQELLNKAGESHQNLVTAIHEANQYAEACNKPKLQMWAMKY